jgi:hypothetical protein
MVSRSSVSQEIMKPNVKRKRGGKLNIKKAIKKPGALRKSLGVKKGETISASKLDKAAKSKGKLGKRARFAKLLKKFKKKGKKS